MRGDRSSRWWPTLRSIPPPILHRDEESHGLPRSYPASIIGAILALTRLSGVGISCVSVLVCVHSGMDRRIVVVDRDPGVCTAGLTGMTLVLTGVMNALNT
jgi:hypothetical protein